MSRPVKRDSTCKRYEYFRKRYLAKKASREIMPSYVDDIASVERMLSKRPPSSCVTWLELSAGRSNS